MAIAEPMLRKLINEIATEQGLTKCDVSIQPISSGGSNYTTQLYLVTVTGDKELRLFAKVAILNEKMRATLNTVFETERYFYKNIAEIYRSMEEKFNVPHEDRISLPKFYGCNPSYLEETIVLEDLVHQGFGDYNRLVSIDWPYAASAVGQLAKFHALSHAYKSQHPEEYEKEFQILKYDLEINEHHEIFWHRNKKLAINVTKEEYKERVEEHLKLVNAFPFKEFLATIHTPVMIHGDYRVSNLMHKYNDDGTVTIKIVDFQTLQRGCPVSDLLYLTLSGTDEEFRRQHFQRLMEHYYEQLCAALKRLGINPDDVYPRKTYDEELKEKLRFALLFAVAALPIMTVESEDAPVVNRPDADISCFAITKTSSVFPERLNGVINDCIRWGLL